jgi:DNA-binding CsgD family transcriptional regulator
MCTGSGESVFVTERSAVGGAQPIVYWVPPRVMSRWPFTCDDDPYELLARARRLVARAIPLVTAVGAELTPRERQVRAMLVDGLGPGDIAKELVISPKTVAKHIEHILAKLGVQSRAQAVALAMRDDLVATRA